MSSARARCLCGSVQLDARLPANICDAGSTRTFCRRCGTTLTYESPRWPGTVDLARACFDDDVGAEPLGT